MIDFTSFAKILNERGISGHYAKRFYDALDKNVTWTEELVRSRLDDFKWYYDQYL